MLTNGGKARSLSMGIASAMIATTFTALAPASAIDNTTCISTITTTSSTSTTGGGTASASASGSSDGCGTTTAVSSSSSSEGEASGSSASATASVSTIIQALPDKIREGAGALDSSGRYASKRGVLKVGPGRRTTITDRGKHLTLQFPAPVTSSAPVFARGTAVTDYGRYVVGQTPMKASKGGGVVVTFTMKDAQSPTAFPIKVSTPLGGAKFKRLGKSVLVLDRAGNKIGMLPKPWAKDAKGSPVATKYVIDGSTVVQEVFPTADTSFPVVADPWFIPAWAIVQIIRCGGGGWLGWIGSNGWDWWWRALAVVGGCLTGMR